MFRSGLLFFFASFILLVCLGRQTHPFRQKKDILFLQEYRSAESLYNKAEKFSGAEGFSEKQEEAMNREALAGYRRVIAMMALDITNDSLAFFCHLKIGILEHYFGNLSAAGAAYSASIAAKNNFPGLADSFLFKPCLYKGTIYFFQNQLDSARLYYQKAEAIGNEYPVVLEEAERLYNTFGNLYLSAGNYRQAKNYFEKAIKILPYSNPYYKALLNNYKINLAATLTKLQEYQSADSIYQLILPENINTNEILHNAGIISLQVGKYRKAISLLKTVKYNDQRQVRIDNDLAKAYRQANQFDSAHYFINQALEESKKAGIPQNNLVYGTSLQESGDLLVSEHKFKEALPYYQAAIHQFLPSFTDADPAKNPKLFSGIFPYIDLVNVLLAKANAFYLWAGNRENIPALEAALNAYRSAFLLSSYIEKTYDSDDARLLLNKISYAIHDVPVEISIRLFELTKAENWLEDAYYFDQRSKASILALNYQQNNFDDNDSANGQLFTTQHSLKAAISRLAIRASGITDSTILAGIRDEIRNFEIRLSKVQDTINSDPAYSRYRSSENIPSIGAVQRSILDDKTSLLSFHLSTEQLVVFAISRTSFGYHSTAIDSSFNRQLREFLSSLGEVSGERKFSGAELAAGLYKTLLGPVSKSISNSSRLIIIPDNDLNFLPFEALLDSLGHYLVHDFSIQYQYSTALLENSFRKAVSGNEVLGLAPFANHSFPATRENGSFARLPNSKEEISALPGNIVIGAAATKHFFLQNANRYPVVHLATHAEANEGDPDRSSIAFYPEVNTENKLYASEIYTLHLDSIRLIILSACETGRGRLVRGEGLMSLSRAFSYAGCPNIITSLWKAEDQTTAFICRRLHFYLEKGQLRDQALQQAKIDLLESNQIEKRFKTPNYWAHLILIDHYEPIKKNRSVLWYLLTGLAGLIMLLFILRKWNQLHPNYGKM